MVLKSTTPGGSTVTPTMQGTVRLKKHASHRTVLLLKYKSIKLEEAIENMYVLDSC